MLKKMGVVTVGVAAGLMVAAPFASASESGHDGHGKHHGESSDCNVTGGSSAANGGIDGDAGLAGNAIIQAPVGGANLANIVCNDILNGNLSGNNVAVSVLGEEAEVPTPDVEAPEAPVDPVIFDVL